MPLYDFECKKCKYYDEVRQAYDAAPIIGIHLKWATTKNKKNTIKISPKITAMPNREEI